MKDMGIVQGSTEQAKELVIGNDVVYVHTDITPITKDQDGKTVKGLYQYHEVQYDKDEYIELMNAENKANTALLNTLLGVNE